MLYLEMGAERDVSAAGLSDEGEPIFDDDGSGFWEVAVMWGGDT